MPQDAEHIVASFDEDLASIKDNVVRMGALAEAQLAGAIEALVKRDPELADRVVQSDRQIDELEVDLNERAVSLIALRQPMAQDLRAAVAALKSANNLERIGDHAASIAKRSKIVSELPPIDEIAQVKQLAQLVQVQIKQIVDAIVDDDEQLALDVWHSDKTVDDHHASLFRSVLDSMVAEGRDIEACTHLLFIAKNIERIGDHATNIAEVLYFEVTGQRIDRGGRPKGELTDLEPVTPSES